MIDSKTGTEEELESLVQSWDEHLKANRIPKEYRDINTLTYGQVADIVDSMEGGESKTQKKKEFKRKALQEADLVFENDEWKVIVPYTEAASKLYGFGTKWCTTGDKDNEFNHYSIKGRKLHYIIPQEEGHMDTRKIAVIVHPPHTGKPMEIRDWEDTKRDVAYLNEATGNSIPMKIFEPYTNLERAKMLVKGLNAMCKVVDGIYVYNDPSGRPIDLAFIQIQWLPVQIGKCFGDFDIQKNELRSFDNFPQHIEGTLDVSDNPHVKSLEGLPKKVTGWIYARGTGISEEDWKKYAAEVGSPGAYV